MEILNNGDSFGIFRGKCNTNFQDLDTRKIEANVVLLKTNTTPFSPSNDYEPSTKKYTDDLFVAWNLTYDPLSIAGDVFDRQNHHGNIDAIYINQDADNRFASDAEKAVWNAAEPAIGAKGTAFNKNFGTTAGTISEGNHNHITLYEAKNANIQTHIGTLTGNPHAVTKAEVGLGSVDNTTDLNKPVSTATQSALNLKADADQLPLKRDLTDHVFTTIQVGDVENGNYVDIDADGELRLIGDSTVWDDDNLDPTALTGTGTDPSEISIASTGLSVAGFSGTSTDEVGGHREYPHKGKLNAVGETSVVMQFHCHCYPSTTAGGNVRLGLEYLFTSDTVAVTTSTTIYVTADIGTTAWLKQNIVFPDIPVPDELGAQFHFRFFRLGGDALDTYGGTLGISTIGYHYPIDSMGSKEITVK